MEKIDNTIMKLLLEWNKPSVWIDYDKEVDVLYISFEKPQKALWEMMKKFITIELKGLSESQFQMQARLTYKIKLLKIQ